MIPQDPYVEPFPGTLAKGKTNKIILSPPQEVWLRKYFPTVSSAILRDMMGATLTTFYRIVKDAGLKKPDEVKKQMWSKASYKGQETKRRNGYYASMRGKAPSPQCIASIKRYWQRVREGKELHFLTAMKQNDPQEYESYCKRIGKNRHRLIQSEHFRMLSGLKRQTKLHLSLVHYTKRQVAHRSNALKRGYWFYEDCSENGGERFNIYFDNDTVRSLRFEANLRKDGFNVLDGTNL